MDLQLPQPCAILSPVGQPSSRGRVVKATDSKSVSLWERRFESYRLRKYFLLGRPCGLMDKAPDFGSGDCRFESCHGRLIHFFEKDPKYAAPGEARTHNPGISLSVLSISTVRTDCTTGANWQNRTCKVWGSNPRNLSITRA